VASLSAQFAELEALPLDSLPEGQRRAVEAKLGVLKKVLAANPLQLAEPYPKQQEFLAAREPLKGFFGGNGAGKSWVGALDDVIQLVDRDVVPAHLQEFKHWEPPFFLAGGGAEAEDAGHEDASSVSGDVAGVAVQGRVVRQGLSGV
jgi:hypothetical protein